MSKKMNEKQVLRKLGIENFRQMTKDKVMSFASALPEMDPEVAKKALEQFPHFIDMAKQVILNMKDHIQKFIEHDTHSQNEVYKAYTRVLIAQENRLNKDNGSLTEEEKDSIIQEMVNVADKIAAKDTEHKSFLIRNMEAVAKVGLGVAAVALVFLGSKYKKGKS